MQTDPAPKHATTLVIGGCRSGKSGHALILGEAAASANRLFIATCAAHDEEMAERIRRHQAERASRWNTVEAPLDIVGQMEQHAPHSGVVLVDCLTLWVSNLMMAYEKDDEIVAQMSALAHALRRPSCPVILVTNEVGAGIVPENRVARRFRDLVGWCNQELAAACDGVVWMVAGIPVTVKPKV